MRFFAAALLTGGFALITFAALAADPVAPKAITIDDYFTQAALQDVAISPDGKVVAYVDARWEPPHEKRNADLWMVRSEGGTPQRLTFDPSPESSPQWSPDGKHLYFLAAYKRRDGEGAPYNNKPQIWRMQIGSDSQTAVTRNEQGIDRFRLSADGQAIVFQVSKDTNSDPWKSLQSKYGKLTFGHGKRKTSQLWKLNLLTWRTELIVDNEHYLHDFAASPDGRRIAMISASDSELISYEGFSHIDVLTVGEQKPERLQDDLWRKNARSPFGWPMSPSWSTDGSRLAFAVSFDGYPTQVIVAHWKSADQPAEIQNLAPAEQVHFEDARLQWASESELIYRGQRQSRQHLYLAKIGDSENTAPRQITSGDCVATTFSVSDNRRMAFIQATPTQSDDVFLTELDRPDGEQTRLTEVNPQMKDWKCPVLKEIHWKGGDGDTVQGILELPADYQPGQKLPLVVDIHGGPTSVYPFARRFRLYGEMLSAANGFARLAPNYHGSEGFGDEFMTKLVGRENEIEVADIIAGVNQLIAEGIVDESKLGVSGWSNGGYLTTAVITADSRFKAASVGAGVVDQVMQWGLEDTPGHVVNFMGGKLPWQHMESYSKASPLVKLDRIKTPVLIHVGENDARVPAAHSRTLHRALSRYLNVPSHLVVYPGEGHSLNQLENHRAKLEWDDAWFKHYLLGTPIP